jgi:hypothetical protein
VILGFLSYAQAHPVVIDHQKLKERLGAIVRTKEGLVSNHCDVPRHDVHTYHRKMLNVGASSPLNLRRKALQPRLNPSASNSSRSMIGHRSFYSSNKSVTSDDRGATDLEGGGSNDPPSIPQNSSLVSFRTEDASPGRDGHDRDRNPPTVLNIRLANGGVYGLERGRSRGRITCTDINAASDSEEGNSGSSVPSHPVRNQTFRRAAPL